MGCDCESNCENNCGCGRRFICQSCGTPMAEQDDFGTKKDGSKNTDYCRFCFHDGEFTDECATAEQKADHIALVVGKMKGSSEQQVKDKAKKYLPMLKELKRWREDR